MGTDAHLVVHGPDDLADLARAELERLESLWSRFRADSEISDLNRSTGRWVPVSPETVTLVERARDGWLATEGAFDPTVLGDVVRAGYDRSFELLTDAGDPPLPTSRRHPVAVGADRVRGAGGIEVDASRCAVRLPAGVGFDPGGIGKGLAADLVAERIDAEGAAGVLVNLGGDLRAIGHGPGGDDWTVAVDPAATGVALTTLAVRRGAVATSTTLRRRWRSPGDDDGNGGEAHHLIDPVTGQPTDGDVVAATVVAARGWQAEVLAKAAIVAGPVRGLDLISRSGADALLVDRFGGLHPTAGFARFTPGPARRASGRASHRLEV